MCLDGLDDVVNDLVNNEDHELVAAVIDDLPFALGNMSDEEDDEAELDATDQYSEDNNREITSQSSEDDGEIIAPSSEVARNSAMETNEVGEGNSDSTNKDVLIPKVKDVIKMIDPDNGVLSEFVVLSRGGKATGHNQYWMNVKNCTDGRLKSIDFEEHRDWEPVNSEIVLKVVGGDDHEASEAKSRELQQWKDYNVYTEVADEGWETISVRWVITTKVIGGKSFTKARLVARGIEEESSNIRKDSSTCLKENLRLIVCIVSLNGWSIHSIDIKSAFLQGYNIKRDVYIKPPKEAATSNKLWKLVTTVYGLVDAPRAWYVRVCDELIKAGLKKSVYDAALFYRYLHGVLCCHVDDFFYAGSDSFMADVIQQIKEKFKVSQEEHDGFKYLGINIIKEDDRIIKEQKEDINGRRAATAEMSKILDMP